MTPLCNAELPFVGDPMEAHACTLDRGHRADHQCDCGTTWTNAESAL